jgi:two-component system NarL family response regulator
VASRIADAGPGAGLTPREVEVLKLVAKGRTNAEIAEELHITSGTAKWFVSSILSKLGVDDRTEAVTTAMERGILHH